MDNPTIVIRRTGGPERLELVDAPLPVPGPGELMVKVEATGVAFADVVMRLGFYPGVKVPVTPGYEVVGTVVSGDGAAPGTRIAALTVTGGYARHAVVTAAHAVPVPDGLPPAKAAALVLNGLTAWQMLTRCVARPSVERMLVWGAGGGVGSILVELGRHFGIETYGVASGSRLALVAARGGIPIDRAAGDVAAQVKARCSGVDAVFDGVGGPNVKVSRAALRPGGAVVMFGFQGGLGGARLDLIKVARAYLGGGRTSLQALFLTGQGLRGYLVTQWRDEHPDFYRADLAELLRLGAGGVLDPPIHAEWPLARAADAHRLMMAGGQSGKIILFPEEKAMAGAAIVIGAGDATGGAIAAAFAREGLVAVPVRRTAEALAPLAARIAGEGGTCVAVGADARDEEAMVALFDRVEAEIGPVEVAVFNIGANSPMRVRDETARRYRKIWEMCALAGFLTGREAARRMVPRGRGTILFTGATASLRGSAGFAAFAGGKFALRALAQSMAREFGPEGIHVAHAIIDGAIDTEFIRSNFPDRYAAKADGGILDPEHIAAQYVMLHQQPRTAWTHELDLRPWTEKW